MNGRIIASLLGIVLIAVACDTARPVSPSVAPSIAIMATAPPSASPTTPTVSPIATVSPSPLPTASPAGTARPASSPTPTSLAKAHWSRVKNQATFANAGMAAVAADAKVYVAVGWTGKESLRPGAAWISTDGRSWRRVPFPSARNAALRGVIHDRLGFVAWGDDSPPESRAAIWTSPDGLTWQRAADIPSFALVEIAGIARLGAQLVAVGGSSEDPSLRAWTSDDGRTWRPVSGTDSMKVVAGGPAATGRVLVASAGDGTVVRSTDGRHWTVVTSSALRGWMEDITASGGRFVGVGASPALGEAGSPPSPARAWTSTDGRTWRQAVLRPAASGWLHLVAAHGREYVALGEGFGPTFAYRSSDGRTWTKLSSAPDTAREGRVATQCTGGPCGYRTEILGLADGPRGPVAVGRTELKSGAYRAVVWVLR